MSARICIVGGGLAGLAAALFLGRRGHPVELLERDEGEPPEDPDSRFQTWTRRGVPQLRQPHIFHGLSRQVLAEEAPDVLAALAAAGCGEDWMAGFGGADPDGLYKSTIASRVTYEAVLRAAVRREPGVTMRTGVEVTGLNAVTTDGATEGAPRVVGVQTALGARIDADLVVDASGRWSQIGAWLAEIDARPPVERLHETPFVYLTRWRRLDPGKAFPGPTAARAALDFAGAFTFAADNGYFSMSLMLSANDPLRGAAARPEAFEAVMAALPEMAPWSRAGTALGKPMPLGRINNGLRGLTDAQGRVATGLVLLGDSAIHTNPNLGRGVSLAMAHAQHLARTADQAGLDPVGFAMQFDAWTAANLDVWFASQVAADSQRLAQIDACLNGTAPPTPPSASRIGAALLALSADDPVAATALYRQVHMFARPVDLLADPALAERVEAWLARPAVPPAPPPISRADFVRLVGAPVAA